MNHLDHLQANVPDLAKRRILDLGSGRGYFLVEAATRGFQIEGLELFSEYIEKTHVRAKKAGVSVTVTKGRGEELPFAAAQFDFINMAELIEHVADPKKVLQEVFRVLSPGGMAYMSVPSRFGMKDPHFHLYGVNWMPRAWSDAFIGFFGAHKSYDTNAGAQRLSEMHYYTYRAIASRCAHIGFTVLDIRELGIMRKYSQWLLRTLALGIYRLMRPWYFGTAHILLTKPGLA